MAREDVNKWTRERSFLQKHGGDLLMLATAVFFLALAIGAVGFVLIKPEIPGLSNVFKDPPPPPRNPMDQKLNLAPGESEVILFDANRKPVPVVPPAPPPPKSPQGR
jgi:hypothetical protein